MLYNFIMTTSVSFSKKWHDALDSTLQDAKDSGSLKKRIGLRLWMLTQDLSIFPAFATVEAICRIAVGIILFPLLGMKSFLRETIEAGMESGVMLYHTVTAPIIPIQILWDIGATFVRGVIYVIKLIVIMWQNRRVLSQASNFIQ